MTTQEKFNNWLDGILQTEKPEDDIIAYWFGICETAEGYETYLIGSKTYDAQDDDWACNVDFAPKEKYFALGQIEVEWQIILEDIKKYLIDYFPTPAFQNSFLKNARAIACGFDGGDLFILK